MMKGAPENKQLLGLPELALPERGLSAAKVESLIAIAGEGLAHGEGWDRSAAALLVLRAGIQMLTHDHGPAAVAQLLSVQAKALTQLASVGGHA